MKIFIVIALIISISCLLANAQEPEPEVLPPSDNLCTLIMQVDEKFKRFLRGMFAGLPSRLYKQ